MSAIQRNTNYITLLTKRLSDEINRARRKIIPMLKLPHMIILSRSFVFWKKTPQKSSSYITSYCTVALFFILYFLVRSYRRILDGNIKVVIMTKGAWTTPCECLLLSVRVGYHKFNFSWKELVITEILE